jgi:hypothetical protein
MDLTEKLKTADGGFEDRPNPPDLFPATGK